MTASQVANMACEMLAAVRQGAPGMDQMLKMCLSDSVVVSALAHRKLLVEGRDDVIQALVTGALVGRQSGVPQAEPIARVVAECRAGGGGEAPLSMAMDVYAGGKSPFAVLAKQGGGTSLVVFRARKSQIDHIWVGDCGAGAKMLCGSKESLLNSPSWRDFSLAVSLSLSAPAEVTFILNNYTKTVDGAGLGIGSETCAETWTEDVVARTDAELRAAEEARHKEQLEKSLAALDKVVPHLSNDKKLAKAAPIFLNMLKSELRLETAAAVVKAAGAAFGGGYERVGLDDTLKDVEMAKNARAARQVLKEAAELLVDKKDVLLQGCRGEVDVAALLEAWKLQHVTAELLRTDDTFQVSRPRSLSALGPDPRVHTCCVLRLLLRARAYAMGWGAPHACRPERFTPDCCLCGLVR